MDCSLIRDQLIGFQLDTLEETERARVEEHLCACAGCVQAFLHVKRAVERGLRAPSPQLRERLRVDVARKVTRRARPVRRPWMVAASAVAVAALWLLALSIKQPSPPAPPSAASRAVDSAAPAVASLSFM